MAEVQDELARLAGLPAHGLRIEWRRQFRSEPPERLSRDLLLRAIAYRVQEQARGGLSQAAKKTLRTLAGKLATEGAGGALSMAPTIKPGVRLVRDWRGQAHSVLVLEDGFEYQGQRYRSLTEIARRITGAHWSGPDFFGMAPVRAKVGSASARRPRGDAAEAVAHGQVKPTAGRRGAAVVRCAVYTRKSSEEGLEQDFNSLHAQREACEAYIKSQKHEGWVVLPGQYDDGGISGATMERPALQQLLADIRARKIDNVVVYKVDRLTRSLADFAKIVEIFDAQDVAFVSVTQHFNTTNSMGRLTLNVLLSFAQFEREVAGERIRDKIAASKQRGMWMGGNLPLGYDVCDRKLVVNEPEAETVRHIFRRYVALRSVRLLAEELADGGITSKQRLTTTGHHVGGRTLARGALYLLLQNHIYLGEIVHKDRHYPGQHSPIVDQELWDRAQALLSTNAGDRRAGRPAKQPSLLAGLIFDSLGHRMSPTHAVKAGKRYRYYISRALIIEGRAKAPAACRIPAAEVEQVVTDRIRALLADAANVFDAIASANSTTKQQGELVAQAAALAGSWSGLLSDQQRRIVSTLIARIEVGEDSVALHVIPARVRAILQEAPDGHGYSDTNDGCDTKTVILSVPRSAAAHRPGHAAHRGRRHKRRCQTQCLSHQASDPRASAATSAAARGKAQYPRAGGARRSEPFLHDTAPTFGLARPGHHAGHPTGTSAPNADSGQAHSCHTNPNRLARAEKRPRFQLNSITQACKSTGSSAPMHLELFRMPRAACTLPTLTAEASGTGTKPHRDAGAFCA